MTLNSSTTCVDMNKCTGMIITGIRGTELESLFKQFYEQMIDDKKIIVQMIKELSSVTPIEIDGMDSSTRRATATSFSCLWSYDYIRFPEYCNPNHVVPYQINGIIFFTPNRCDKVAEKFMKEWRRRFKDLMVFFFINSELTLSRAADISGSTGSQLCIKRNMV